MRQLRHKRGLTLAQLAEQAKVDVSALSRIERGEQFSKKHAPKLVKFFGKDEITLDQILYWKPSDAEASA